MKGVSPTFTRTLPLSAERNKIIAGIIERLEAARKQALGYAARLQMEEKRGVDVFAITFGGGWFASASGVAHNVTTLMGATLYANPESARALADGMILDDGARPEVVAFLPLLCAYVADIGVRIEALKTLQAPETTVVPAPAA